MKSSGSQDFERAFQRMKSATRLCMGLIEAANGDSASDERDVWAAVDAIIESASRDVKDIWKGRYRPTSTINGNGRRLQEIRAGDSDAE